MPDVEGVCSGAIHSNYQRDRVENICERLGLISFGYLWRREQRELLQEMIDVGMESAVIKCCSIGLNRNHLGKTLAELQHIFLRNNDRFGMHVCGEGGEYETFTLNCPLFKKRIVVDEADVIVHSDNPIDPVLLYRLRKWHLEDKEDFTMDHPALKPVTRIPKYIPVIRAEDVESGLTRPGLTEESVEPTVVIKSDEVSAHIDITTTSMKQACEEFLASLEKEALLPERVASIYFAGPMSELPELDSFLESSRIYPSRCNVGTASNKVHLSVIVGKEKSKYALTRLRSLSHRAPAVAGCNAQGVQVDNRLYLEGQRGIVPGTGILIEGGISAELAQLTQNCDNLLVDLPVSWTDLTELEIFVKNGSEEGLNVVKDTFTTIINEYCSEFNHSIVQVFSSAELQDGASIEIVGSFNVPDNSYNDDDDEDEEVEIPAKIVIADLARSDFLKAL
eukprot:TRINITY_DN6025_c0_g1_i2.p1 TRINITY_DN6025_c0_g1~~TRINITY_DN6025_c0_g1_i2.p1  ORF type:complete len:450 (+),score=168.35 TRINITY_DN6025_c0_g1_i2:506-1855(+)